MNGKFKRTAFIIFHNIINVFNVINFDQITESLLNKINTFIKKKSN